MYHITVDGLPPSLNRLYSGMHWARRKAMADEWHLIFKDALRKKRVPKPLDCLPIRLEVTQTARRPRDCDNVVVSAKLLLDAMRDGGYIKDDSPEYVGEVVLRSVKGDSDSLACAFGEAPARRPTS